jgi:type II restriction enzyme
MVCAIREDRTPNLLLLRYDQANWCVRDLLLIPHFAFPESAIIERKPLSDTARRAGWVGCNIALDRIAPDARIPIVVAGNSRLAGQVRADYKKLKPLSEIGTSERGWTLDVLNAVRKLGKAEFTTHDAYSLDSELQQLHPGNRHVRPKIRQQLQVLRDAGILLHLGRNHWRLP